MANRRSSDSEWAAVSMVGRCELAVTGESGVLEGSSSSGLEGAIYGGERWALVVGCVPDDGSGDEVTAEVDPGACSVDRSGYTRLLLVGLDLCGGCGGGSMRVRRSRGVK